MSNKKRLAIIVLGTILPATAALAGNYFVKNVNISASKPYPVLTVKSNGKQYTHVEDNGVKTFHAHVTGECTNMAYVAWASYALIKTPEYKSMNHTLAEKILDVSGKRHKTFGHHIPVNVKWKPDGSVKQRAVDACNSYLNDALKQHSSLYTILSKQHSMVVASGVYGNFGLACDGNLHMSTDTIRKSSMQAMKVICDTSNVPKPARAEVFRIKNVGFAPMTQSYTGSCPKDFKFVGFISTDGVGKLRYRFKYDTGAISHWKTVTIKKGSSGYHLEHYIKLQDIKTIKQPNLPNEIMNQQGNGIGQIPQLGGLQQSPWLALEVENLTTHKKYLKKANYKYQCVQPPKMQVGKLNLGGGKPDLIVLANTFRLGSKTASGNKLVIGADEASKKIGGKCRFRSLLKIRNQGQGDAKELFSTRIRSDNVTLLIDNLTGLKKGQSGNVSGNLMLPAGNSTLLIETDHADKVNESNEGNNLARIMVTVKGDCGGDAPPRPGSGNGNPPRPADPAGAPARPVR